MVNDDERYVATLCDHNCGCGCPLVLKKGIDYAIKDDFGGKAVLSKQYLIDLTSLVNNNSSCVEEWNWPKLGWDITHYVVVGLDGGKVKLTQRELKLMAEKLPEIMGADWTETSLKE